MGRQEKGRKQSLDKKMDGAIRQEVFRIQKRARLRLLYDLSPHFLGDFQIQQDVLLPLLLVRYVQGQLVR